MKYLALRELDTVTSALNFNTGDCHLDGGCDLYITKAVRADKKLYKDIDTSLTAKHERLLHLSASLSPPEMSSYGFDLSRASPFGPLSASRSRRTFAYLVATLNASHPDYEFSDIVRPTDFQKLDDLTAVMRDINETMNGLRRSPPAALLAPPPGKGAKSVDHGAQTPGGSVAWNPNMWKLIDKEMKLTSCDIFEYAPDEDPFDDHALWCHHLFFFNAAKKRVCYLYIRAQMTMGHSPVTSPHAKRGRPVSQSWSVPDAGANKRAKYWLGERAADVEDEEDELDAQVDPTGYDDTGYYDGGGSSDDGPRNNNDESDDDEIEKRFRDKSAVRGMSEHIAESMDP